VFPVPPIVAVALAAVAALLATYLPRPAWLARAIDWMAAASPLGWYLLGLVLGPALGVLDDDLLGRCTPAIACAIGWIAARAGATLAAPLPPGARRPLWPFAGVVLTLAVPAALLYGAGRFLPPAFAPVWMPPVPVIATLVAALAVAGGRDARLTGTALLVAALALVALLPHAHRADLRRDALWLVWAGGGAVVAALVAARLARAPATPLPATIAGVGLAAGLGLATGASPLVGGAVLGALLARRSAAHARLALDLALLEPVAGAALWVAAGAWFGGRIPVVAGTAVLLAVAPLLRRVLAPAPPDLTLGLAIALSFAVTARDALGATGPALVTTASLALLLCAAASAIAPRRLTSPTPTPEVSV
jgi:hypothetical protein